MLHNETIAIISDFFVTIFLLIIIYIYSKSCFILIISYLNLMSIEHFPFESMSFSNLINFILVSFYINFYHIGHLTNLFQFHFSKPFYKSTYPALA